MLISLRMAWKLQLHSLILRVLLITGFALVLLLPGALGYTVFGSAALTGGLGVALGNGILLVWSSRNRWRYTLDEKGIHLVMGSSSFASSRLLFNWQQASLSSISLHHWRDLPSIEVVPEKGRKIVLVYEPQEQRKVLQEVLPLLEQHRIC